MGEKLGQHFLKNKSVLEKITGALDLKKNDTVIEIGPGHGELTKELKLAVEELKIVAIEKDGELVLKLKENFPEGSGVEIIGGDALKVLPTITGNLKLGTDGYKLAGNIPYYITAHLFRIIEELKNKPTRCVFLIQKEVAERIVEQPPKMNKLAASIQFWAEPKIIASVSRENFSPKPKVDSAIIRLQVSGVGCRVDERNYYKAMNAIFKQPRKTVLNNLTEAGLKKEDASKKLDKMGINPLLRPQNLTVKQISEIALAWGDNL